MQTAKVASQGVSGHLGAGVSKNWIFFRKSWRVFWYILGFFVVHKTGDFG